MGLPAPTNQNHFDSFLDYKIEKKLGKACTVRCTSSPVGMKNTHQARPKDDGRRSTLSLARLRKEAAILARIRHSGLPEILEVGETPDGQPYLILEYLEAESGRPPEKGPSQKPNT